jgi:octaprenyl-diphosphate synthase
MIHRLYAKYKDKLDQVVDFSSQLCSNDNVSGSVCEYLFAKSGKNLRPLLFYILNRSSSSDCQKLTAIIYLIHNATLLHDDVIDQSQQRRNEPAVHVFWSNRISILSGDFLLAKVFDLIVLMQNFKVLEFVNGAINKLVEAELQHMRLEESFLSEKNYIDLIAKKTSSLFEMSVQFASLINNFDDSLALRLEKFAYHIGIAFQISDDLLDYDINCSLGKSCGDDFRESKITYPVIMALENGVEKDFWRRVMIEKQQNNNDLEFAIEVMKKNGIFDMTIDKILEHCRKAVEQIVDLDLYFNDLIDFAAYPINRLDDSSLFGSIKKKPLRVQLDAG